MKLLEHFKELTVHPKNAEELKGLILQLAVQGKLTNKWREENPDAERASILLERIEIEKVKLVKSNKIKKQKSLPKITNDEIPFELPDSWSWCRWVELLGFVDYPMKRGPFGSALRKDNFVEKGIRVFEQYNPINDDPNWVRYYITEEKYEELKAFTAIEGDLLISCSGTLGRIGELVKGTEKGIINQALLKITLHPEVISNQYFIQLFRSYFMQSRIYAKAMGSAITNMVGVAELKQFLIPLPPLEEQKAIVEVVNQLFVEVEQLEALTKERIQLKEDFVTSALSQLTQASESDVASHWNFLKGQFGTFFNEKENIKKLREAILQLAVQGKLTHQWRTEAKLKGVEVEPASLLLEKIKAEKAQLIKTGKIKKEKPLPEISEEEIPYELPEGWVWCRVGQILNVKSSKRVFKTDYVQEGVPFFRSKEIGQLGRGQEVTTELFISRERFEDFKMNFGVPKQGDVLMACIGGSIGNTWLVDKREFYYKDGNLVQLDCTPEIDSFYLLKYLDSNVFYDSAMGRVSGSAYNALTIEKIKNSLFPLPNENEQKAIVEKVNSLMGFCDSLEKEIEQNTQQLEDLMQSCLREVFESKAEEVLK